MAATADGFWRTATVPPGVRDLLLAGSQAACRCDMQSFHPNCHDGPEQRTVNPRVGGSIPPLATNPIQTVTRVQRG